MAAGPTATGPDSDAGCHYLCGLGPQVAQLEARVEQNIDQQVQIEDAVAAAKQRAEAEADKPWWQTAYDIVGSTVTGIVAGGLCGVATVGTGLVDGACEVAGGAAGGLAYGALSGCRSWKCYLKDGLVGGALAGLGQAASALVSQISAKLAAGLTDSVADGAAAGSGDGAAGSIVDPGPTPPTPTPADIAPDPGTPADADGGQSDAACLGGESFTAATKVVMADGSSKSLDQVKTGDMVKATNTANGKTSSKTVSAVWINHDHDLMDVTVASTNGSRSVIHATAHHLFYDDTRHGWVQAEALTRGDRLHTAGRQRVRVISTRTITGAADMWDLTVTTDHDFYIVTSNSDILVHNCGTGDSGSGDVEGTTRALQSHVDAARAAYDNGDIGLSAAQARAAGAYPGLEPMFRGSVIDSAAKASVAADPALSSVFTTPNFTRGADFFDSDGNWWDMTTEGQWAAHVSRYDNYFGGPGIRLSTDG